ncbi:aminopeptidase, partial [Oleiphilus sp. HI0132]
YQQAKAEQKKLMSFVLSYKDKLHDVYQDDSWSVEKKRKEKDKLLKEMKLSFQSLKQKHAWDSRYDRWVNELNNAGFSTLSNYQDLVPGFIALYHRLGEDWDAFYQEVERLSELDKSQRHAHLKSLSEAIGEHQ